MRGQQCHAPHESKRAVHRICQKAVKKLHDLPWHGCGDVPHLALPTQRNCRLFSMLNGHLQFTNESLAAQTLAPV